jgi:hypothetical protein
LIDSLCEHPEVIPTTAPYDSSHVLYSIQFFRNPVRARTLRGVGTPH